MSDSNGATEPLPPLYEKWVQALLNGGPPRETRATCSDCAMCERSDSTAFDKAQAFDPSVKCCTFVPDMPNFLVGGILNDRTRAAATGRGAMLKRLTDKIAVSPLGVAKPPAYSRLYDESDDNSFGRTKMLGCPYLMPEGKGCGVWRHRNAVCATWFCKHEKGQTGEAFWREALKPMLDGIEEDLAIWCALQLDIGVDALRTIADAGGWSWPEEPLTAEALDNRIDQDAYDRVWGKWLGREAEFYSRAALKVARLSFDQVLDICGPRVRVMSRLTRDAFKDLISDAPPKTATVGELTIVHSGPATTRVTTYSPYDPVDVPSAVMANLHVFDGRSTKDAVKAIAVRSGVKLEAAEVRRLTDFGVLVAGE